VVTKIRRRAVPTAESKQRANPCSTDTGDIYAGVDRFGRVKDLRWQNVTGNADLSRVQYGYDRASNRTWRANPTDAGSHHDWLYAYDGLQRLEDAERGTLAGGQTAIDDPQFRQCWTLDAVGNWSGFRQDDSGAAWSLIQSRTTNPVNEITAITNTVGPAWAQPAYDPAGNMTTVPWMGTSSSGLGWAELTVNEWAALTAEQWSDLLVSSSPTPPAGSLTATYDAWNRLVRAAGEDLDEAYAYDATNYRITTSRGAAVRHHYYTNAWQVVEERTGNSSTANRQFVWGLRYIDDLILRDRGSERLYALPDGNWNVTAVVDHAGAVQERYEYDPYGVPAFLDADFDPRAVSAHDWETLYAGYRWNARTGLYHVRFRDLLPVLGWLQRDPLGYVDGPGLYGYIGGMPLTAVDPSGLGRRTDMLNELYGEVGIPRPPYTDADRRFDQGMALATVAAPEFVGSLPASVAQGATNIANAAGHYAIDTVNTGAEAALNPTWWTGTNFVPEIPQVDILPWEFIKEDPVLRKLGGDVGLLGFTILLGGLGRCPASGGFGATGFYRPPMNIGNEAVRAAYLAEAESTAFKIKLLIHNLLTLPTGRKWVTPKMIRQLLLESEFGSGSFTVGKLDDLGMHLLFGGREHATFFNRQFFHHELIHASQIIKNPNLWTEFPLRLVHEPVQLLTAHGTITWPAIGIGTSYGLYWWNK
jgi:RHS repeat-associated protein